MENRKESRANTAPKLSDFTQLQTWEMARKLRREVYQLSRSFPSDEQRGLASQMRRAVVSITANIAEGYGRFSYQENIQFCRQSRASAYELRDHLTTAADAGYLSKERVRELDSLALDVVRLLNGYIRATKKLKAGGSGA